MKIYLTYYQSPIGVVEIVGSREHIVAVNFVDQARTGDIDLPACIQDCANQIDEYFKGNLKKFSLKLQMQGTDFQKTVWRQLTKVAYGQTASYGEIAAAIGKPSASRAVGHANGRNPIAIIVPCHRIIGTDGSLTGYGGGLWRKEWLLHHERDKH
jgi:methylated-DNA-[protein]-cysteine S-methyltransferase